jgi:hypothetical protein
MAEITRTMSEWIAIDQRERRERRELLRELAEYQKTHPPIMMSAFRPKAVTAPPVPPKPMPMPMPVITKTTTDAEIAELLGISPKELQDGIGMPFQRLAEFIDAKPQELFEMIANMLRVNLGERGAQAAFHKLKRYCVQCSGRADRKQGFHRLRAQAKAAVDRLGVKTGEIAKLREAAYRDMAAKSRKVRGW